MVAITSVLAIAVAIIWTLGVMGAETYTQTTATIKASDETNWISADAIISGDGTNGTGWFQDDVSGWYEECYTEDDGYEYCNEFWVEEYECYADLLLSWNYSDSEYSGWAYTPSVITPFGCLDLMEEYYQIGDVIPIWHVDSEPSEFQTFTVRFGSSSEFGTYWSETMYHWLEWDTLSLMTEYTCEATIAVSSPATADSVTLVLDGWNDGGAIYAEWSEQSCIELSLIHI